MQAITVQALTKTYKTRVKEPGLKASAKALFAPMYKETQAVKGIDFAVERGERVAFIGPNGAGKSTTIKMMTGILHPTSGSADVLGLSPQNQRTELSYQIGTVFGQKSQLWFHLPPADSFQLLGAIYDLKSAELKKRTDELVDRFSLGDIWHTPVRKLSLGQRVRCEVAASFLHRPQILFLDEPTIGLDVVVKQSIRELVREMNRELNTTIFLTSHDASDVEHLCRRAMIIDQGSLIVDQPVKELKQTYFSHKVIAVRFDGEPTLNPPEGVTVEKQSANGAGLTVDTKKHRMDEIMRWLVGEGFVTDITVEDPPMESIIADIFTGGARERGELA